MRVVHCLVVGSPIRHSRSPFIHRLFAEQFGLALRYDKCEVAAGQLATAVARFVADGVRGINVTIPLKEEAWALAQRATSRASVSGAANVLSFGADGEIEADNTDGLGMVRDLAHHGVPLAGARVLLLGAGGAARGVVPALFEAGIGELVISNRTPEKAALLAERFSPLGKVTLCAPDGTCAEAVDLIVNSTSAGLTVATPPPVPVGALGTNTSCYDLVYGSRETPFLRWAREQGVARRADGLGMLVEQAAAAFTRWHGLEPETMSVTKALRQRL